jgi:ABC-type multidrug transport system fused ATPase/permease subunit
MRLRTIFDEGRLLATPAILQRAAVVSASALVQRLLAPAMAWVLFGSSLPMQLGVALALSVVFTAHTLTQRMFAARTEADLLDRTAAAVLDGDVLRAGVASEDDARVEIVTAIFHAAQAVSQTLPNLVADLVSCVLLGAWVVRTEPARFVLLAGTLTVVAAGALFVSRRSVERAVARAWDVQEQAYETFADILDGRLEVVASGFRGAFLEKLRRKTTDWGAAGAAVAASSALSGRLPLLAIAILVAVALVLSPSIRQSASASLAEVALFASVTPAFAGVAQGLHGLTRVERWVGVVAHVIRSAVGPTGGTSASETPRGEVRFDDVSFGYPGVAGAAALREVSFTWEGRGALALAGPNGSGKSTCLRLLLALAAPVSGAVRVGGVALAQVDADAWRRQVAFMPQRPYLPPRSDVAQAVRWLAPAADDERVLRALDRVGILPSLQRGGRDPLKVRVDTLSVGERQRIALARLLSRDASLFVLDEPDANLDRAGIALVADVIRELAREHGVIFAAHTPELLGVAAHVVTLEGGRVVGDTGRAAVTSV